MGVQPAADHIATERFHGASASSLDAPARGGALAPAASAADQGHHRTRVAPAEIGDLAARSRECSTGTVVAR